MEKANNCYLINPNFNNKLRVSSYSNPNKESSDPNQRPRGKDSMVGQLCMVIKGGWKGFEGIVKDADDKSVRMELSAKAKVITVLRDCVRLKTDLNENENENDAGARLDQSLPLFLKGFYDFFIFFSGENTDTSRNEEQYVQSGFALPSTEPGLGVSLMEK